VFCTGTVVAPRAVLTAAHCLEDLERGASFEVFAGDRVGEGGEYRLVTDFRVSSTWDGTRGDIGVVRLDSAFTTLVMLPITTVALDGTVVGQPVRVVGFGLGVSTDLAPDGQRRQGTMSVIGVGPETLDTRAGPAVTCQGDSGGPVLLDRGAGEEIVGVTASGDVGCSQSAIDTRVDVFSAEIASWLAEIAAAPDEGPEATIAIEATCSAPCTSDDDCPAKLSCIDNDGESRCATTTAVPEAYGETCSDDATCGGGRCARIWSHGAVACRCATSCPSDDPGCGGCGAGTDQEGLAMMALAGWLVRRRRRVVPFVQIMRVI
jgi:uncharacterized protein (TIGR03382 family)